MENKILKNTVNFQFVGLYLIDTSSIRYECKIKILF